jgi:hypothetical protein
MIEDDPRVVDDVGDGAAGASRRRAVATPAEGDIPKAARGKKLGHRFVEDRRTRRARMEEQHVSVGRAGEVDVEAAAIWRRDTGGGFGGDGHVAILAPRGGRRRVRPTMM